MLFGIVDLMSVLLIILPLYPNPVNEYIYSVPLFAYTELTLISRIVYWIMFVSLIIIGAVKVTLNQIKIERGRKHITNISFVCSIITVLLLSMTREAYAIVVVFLLLVIKTVLVLGKKNFV